MKRYLVLAFICFAISPLGCSSRQESSVTGIVTVDGEPAKAGYIGFYPADEKLRASTGVIKDGQFSVAVPPGSQSVQIRVSKVVGIRKGAEVFAEALPAKYNEHTELRIDVKPGANVQNFDLKTN